MHIAIDLDDVTVGFWPGVLRAFELEYGVRLPDMHPWGEQAQAFAKHELFAKSGMRDWWGWLRKRYWLWERFPPVPGAIGSIEILRAQGHYVEAVTSKPEWAERAVHKWIGHYGVPFQRVTIITAPQEKVDFTDADLIIDDKLATVESFENDDRMGIWFNQTWEGAEEAQLRGIWVARDWERVLELVDAWSMEETVGATD